jgi:ankyrin repeat protein
MRGDRDAIELLLRHGADLNVADRDGDACLHTAAGSSCQHGVSSLLGFRA